MHNEDPILILTASYGDGHLQAARSLQTAFERRGAGQVIIMDLMQEAHPFINKITKTLYIKSMLSSEYGFDYYGWSYYITKNAKFHTGWNRYLNNLGWQKLKTVLQQMRPRAVVTTFPFGAVPELCRELDIPAFSVVTDFSLHARWIHPNIHKYYVATKELQEQLIAKAIAPDRIAVSGIPIRQAFDDISQREPADGSARPQPACKTILILAGAYGVLASTGEMIDALIRIAGCRVLVICGRNQRLEQELLAAYEQEPNVTVFGFTEHIHQLMAASSCVVTKAGGLTLSEALSLQLPMFIYKPFAGQEKENALYFSEKGAARISEQIGELALQVERFFANPYEAVQMRKQMQLLHQKSAASSIAADVLESIRQPEAVY